MNKYDVVVEFCMMWNFAPKAASVAEELFTHFRGEIEKLELIPSSGGVFEVTVNNEKIYSKKETGKFPSSKELIDKMESNWFAQRPTLLKSGLFLLWIIFEDFTLSFSWLELLV